jgi:hypothetical protein
VVTALNNGASVLKRLLSGGGHFGFPEVYQIYKRWEHLMAKTQLCNFYLIYNDLRTTWCVHAEPDSLPAWRARARDSMSPACFMRGVRWRASAAALCPRLAMGA